jgi:hypothetical protein
MNRPDNESSHKGKHNEKKKTHKTTDGIKKKYFLRKIICRLLANVDGFYMVLHSGQPKVY